MSNPYAVQGQAVAYAAPSVRSAFIQRTYLHLAVSVLAFVLIDAAALTFLTPERILNAVTPMLQGWGTLLFFGAFMVVSWVARGWAESDASPGMQYAGLSLYVVAEALFFLPLLALATRYDPLIPMNAGLVTLFIFAGLTGFVFITGTDFSGIGRFLWLAGMAAMAVVVVGMISGFTLGLWFSGLMVMLASGYILYDTSNVMLHYRTDQHVAASLALFASVALLFWYVLRIFMALREN